MCWRKAGRSTQVHGVNTLKIWRCPQKSNPPTQTSSCSAAPRQHVCWRGGGEIGPRPPSRTQTTPSHHRPVVRRSRFSRSPRFLSFLLSIPASPPPRAHLGARELSKSRRSGREVRWRLCGTAAFPRLDQYGFFQNDVKKRALNPGAARRLRARAKPERWRPKSHTGLNCGFK